ncbi:MAG: hypothetical protein AAGE94_19800 [Acidobacteriota bacterium]
MPSTAHPLGRPAFRHAVPAIVALLWTVWGGARIAQTWTVLSPTADEPTHLGAGMELLDRGTYTYERLHPPLARAATALGPFLDGRRSTGAADPITEGRRLLYADDATRRVLALARAGILPFFVLGALGVWWLATRLGDRWTAAVAVGLYAHLPPILAHAGLATTDMAGAATFLLAVGGLAAWLERPTWNRAVALGVAGGLAVATKYSALPFLGSTAIGLVAWRRLVERTTWDPRQLVGAWRLALLAAGTAFLVVWGAHGFGVESLVGPRERPYRHVDALVGAAGTAHDLVYAVIEAPIVPVALRSVRDGLVATLAKNREGHTGFLLGAMDTDGWWFFFPVAIAVKTPIPFLVLAAIGAWLAWRDGRRGSWRSGGPLIAIVAILAVSLPSRINIGLRHVLAIYPLLAILAAMAASWLWRLDAGRRRWPTRLFVVLLVAWQVVTVNAAHPDHLPWFNRLASAAPERVLNDSDLDWGQDLDRLADELATRDVEHVWLAYFGSADTNRHDLPAFDVLPMDRPVEGWVAISLFQARGLYLRAGPSGPYAWLAEHRPVTRVGASIDLYFVAPPAP